MCTVDKDEDLSKFGKQLSVNQNTLRRALL